MLTHTLKICQSLLIWVIRMLDSYFSGEQKDVLTAEETLRVSLLLVLWTEELIKEIANYVTGRRPIGKKNFSYLI